MKLLNRKDIVAAKVFATALDDATREALKSRLFAMASAGAKRPEPTTRHGLALIAFTERDTDFTDAEHSEAVERVVPLWTEEEAGRYLKYWEESLGKE